MAAQLLASAAVFAVMYAPQPATPQIADDLGVSPATAGWSIGVLVLAVAVAAPLWPLIGRRLGTRRAITVAVGALAPLTALIPLAGDVWTVLAVRALQGGAVAGVIVCSLPYVAHVYVPRHGRLAVGLAAGATILGGLTGRITVALLAPAVGWRIAIALLAPLPLVAALLLRRLPDIEVRARRASLPALARDRELVAAAGGGALLYAAFVAIFSFLGFRLEALHVGALTGAAVYGLWMLGIVTPFVGRVLDRVGWRRVLLGALGLASSGIALTAIPSRLALVGGLSLAVLGMFVGLTASQAGVSAVSEHRREAASAAYVAVYYGAGAIGAVAPGVALEAAGWDGLVTVASIAVALAAVLVTTVRTRPRPSARGFAQ